MTKEKIKMPSVLAFEKKLVPSDGFMFEATWENRNQQSKFLELVDKSVRGTISNRLKPEQTKDVSKLNAEVQKPNLQRVDNCALSLDNDTLKLEFTLKVLGGIAQSSACNSPIFAKLYSAAVENYIKEEGFKELGKRYATNLANARFLWRNRVGAEIIEVVIEQIQSDKEGKDQVRKKWEFANAKEISLKNFNHNDTQIIDLGNKIAEALSDQIPYLLLKITAFAKVGKGQDVYPSEELVLDKDSNNSKGKKSKILYQIKGKAAMHSQKIGNAIRSIDDWYSVDHLEEKPIEKLPIAVEPYGSVTNLGVAYRISPTDFFSLFDKKFIQNNLSQEERHYVMAILVRGGVFGESGKNKSESDGE